MKRSILKTCGRTGWISSIQVDGTEFHFPYKYKIGFENVPTEEYSTVFRLAEQYLIRAEAQIQSGKIVEGINDLNVLRRRATDTTQPLADQLSSISVNLTKEDALNAVENERRYELFTEWGHRWFDLKRTSRSNDVLTALKGAAWQDTDLLFPIPYIDLFNSPYLRDDQNPGYN